MPDRNGHATRSPLVGLGVTVCCVSAAAFAQPVGQTPRHRQPDALTRDLVTAGIFGPSVTDARTVALARAYGGDRYGILRGRSRPLVAIRLLLRQRSPALVAALEVIAARGTPAGKVYALGALWGLDREAFARAAAPLRACSDVVLVLDGGCVQTESRIPLSELIESTDPNAVRLTGPEDSIGAWWRRAQLGPRAVPRYDVVGGGIWSQLRAG